MVIPYLQILFSCAAFIGAYLLFVVQPMVGKLLLPTFGGVSSVWTTVMLFFTGILLLGYGYVAVLNRYISRVERIIHGFVVFSAAGLIVRALFVSHGSFFGVITTPAGNLPVLPLLLLLGMSLALPCFVLATTSVLLQHWHTKLLPEKSPYYLYIISNIGSLFGLLSYPFLIEPHLTLRMQQNSWNWGFIIYVVLMGIIIVCSRPRIRAHQTKETQVFSMNTSMIGWFLYPLVGTLAMLAFTSQLTSLVSSMPFIWVATMGVYLLSYVVAFIEGDWYPRTFYATLLLSILVVVTAFISRYIRLGYQVLLPVSLVSLFIIDFVCHRELFRIKPHPKHLSAYYFIIALGGFSASVFIGIVAPLVFPDYWEYQLVILATGIIGIYMLLTQTSRSLRIHGIVYGGFVLFISAAMFFFTSTSEKYTYTVIKQARNFYGMHTVMRSGSGKTRTVVLMNGHTIHGLQEIGGSREGEPTTYYVRESGMGQAIQNHPKRLQNQPMHIGVIGLGVGTTAAFCNRGDYMRFYEINPQIVDISKRDFTYLTNAQKAGCTIDIVLGDARVSLQRERDSGESMKFDILVVDAFVGDTVPIHLLTKEAISLYMSRIQDGGIVAFNVGNNFLDIGAVLSANIQGEHIFMSREDSPWFLMTRTPISGINWTLPAVNNKIRLWTDQYSNVYEILRH